MAVTALVNARWPYILEHGHPSFSDLVISFCYDIALITVRSASHSEVRSPSGPVLLFTLIFRVNL